MHLHLKLLYQATGGEVEELIIKKKSSDFATLGLKCMNIMSQFYATKVSSESKHIPYSIICELHTLAIVLTIQQKYLLFYKCEASTGLTTTIKLSFLPIYLLF